MNKSGTQIVDECIGRYKAMQSYIDNGVVRTWYDSDPEPHERAFTTWYMKPKFFRFDFRVPHPYPPLRDIVTEHSCGFDGKTAYSLTRNPDGEGDLKVMESLELAIAGATGISGRAAHTIGQLLLPQVSGFSLDMLADVTIEGEVEVDSALCYEIKGFHPRGGARIVWIEKEDLLIRKLSNDDRECPNEEVRLDIQVNPRLGRDVFVIPQYRALKCKMRLTRR